MGAKQAPIPTGHSGLQPVTPPTQDRPVAPLPTQEAPKLSADTDQMAGNAMAKNGVTGLNIPV